MKEIARAQRFGVRPSGWVSGIAITFLSLALVGAASASAEGVRTDNGGPPILKHSTDLGLVDPASAIEITLWLKLRDEKGLDSTIAAQRQKGAAFLSGAQIDSQLAPTAASVADVSRFLKSQGLKVAAVGPHNLFVRAEGTVGLVQSALGVEVHQYRLKEMTFRASPTEATLPPAIAQLVASVSGLSSLAPMPNVAHAVLGLRSQPNIARQSDAEGLRANPIKLAAGANGLVFSAQCFLPPTSVSFGGGGSAQRMRAIATVRTSETPRKGRLHHAAISRAMCKPPTT